MSHFTLLVIGDYAEDQLDPYCEQTEDKQYLDFFDAEAEYRADYDSGQETKSEWYASDNMWLSKKEYTNFLNFGELKLTKHAPDRYFCSGNLKSNSDDQMENVVRIDLCDGVRKVKSTVAFAKVTYFKKEYTSSIQDKILKDMKENPPVEMKDAYEILAKRLVAEKGGFYIYDATLKLIDPPKEIPLKEIYPNISDYMEDWHGLQIDEDTNKYGYWKNPNAKWDWYVLGGRWSGFFTLKDGTTSDSELKKNIDFEAMAKKSEVKAIQDWDNAHVEKLNSSRMLLD